MDFIQPIFVNQTSDIVQGKLGPDNASFPLQKINDTIQKDIDVVIEQFSPGVMKRLGLDWNTLKKVNRKS